MRSGKFEKPTDIHGRDVDALAPGATLKLSTSSTAVGDYIPGNREEIQKYWVILRIVADKDCYIKFSKGPSTATNADVPFQAGTESMRVPDDCDYVSAVTMGATTGYVAFTVMQ